MNKILVNFKVIVDFQGSYVEDMVFPHSAVNRMYRCRSYGRSELHLLKLVPEVNSKTFTWAS